MAGLAYIVVATVLAVANIAILAARLVGQLLGLTIALTLRRPKLMGPIIIMVAVAVAIAAYWDTTYTFVRGEMHAMSTGVRAGHGSNSDLCKMARTTFMKLAHFNPDLRRQFHEALDQRCWHIPQEEVRLVCLDQTVKLAQRPSCLEQAETCYRNAMEFAVGRLNTASEASECLNSLRMVNEIKARQSGSQDQLLK